MMTRKGFSLPEVIFGLAIGTMIALILFESITQTNQVFARVTSLSSIERNASLLQQQFENDFSGMFSPRIPEEKDEDGKKEGKDGEKSDKDSGKDEKKSEKKEDEKSVFKSFVFEGTTQGLVNIMTFVTSNPLLSYKQPLPRIVRVAYRVLPDPEHEGKLLLVRQQSEELSMKKFEEATKKETKKSDQTVIRSYEIARNLESVKFEFFIEKIEKKKDEKDNPPLPGATKGQNFSGKDKEDKEEKPRSFILIDDWLKLSEEERNKFEAPEIPAFIHLQVGMQDDIKRLRTFDFWFAPVYGGVPSTMKGIASDLPDEGELFQRQLADEETKRMYLHNGVPQQGMGVR